MEAEKGGAPEEMGEVSHEEDSVMSSWLTVDEESEMELSELLESFGSAPPPVKVLFIDDPYASAVVFHSSSAYVTINGNEESCGSSFSDSDSSMMVSINVDCSRMVTGDAWWRDAGDTREWSWEGTFGGSGMDIEWDCFLIDECDFHPGGGGAPFLGEHV